MSFPEGGHIYDLNSFISILLNKKISNRICKLHSLKNQSLFKDFEWEGLLDFKVKPPFIPKDLREWKSNLKNKSSPLEAVLSVKN